MRRGAQWLRLVVEAGGLPIEARDDGGVDLLRVVRAGGELEGVCPRLLVLVYGPIQDEAAPLVDGDLDVVVFGDRVGDGHALARRVRRDRAQGVGEARGDRP